MNILCCCRCCCHRHRRCCCHCCCCCWKRQFLLQHKMQAACNCQPVKGLSRGLCHQRAVQHITWCPGRGYAVEPQHGSSLTFTAVEATFNLVSVGLCPKLLPPLDKKRCIVFHLGEWVVSKRRSYVLLVIWQEQSWDFTGNFILCVLKMKIAVWHNFLFLCSLDT